MTYSKRRALKYIKKYTKPGAQSTKSMKMEARSMARLHKKMKKNKRR